MNHSCNPCCYSPQVGDVACLQVKTSKICFLFLTKPTDEKKLKEFYLTVYPGGVLWKKISVLMPEVKSDSGFARMFLNWFLGVVLIYSFLLEIGSLVFGGYLNTVIYLAVAAVSLFVVLRNISE